MSTIENEIIGNVIYIHRHVRVDRAESPGAHERKPPRVRTRRLSAVDANGLPREVDDELVEQVVMGDLVAAEHLRRRHHADLLALAMHVLRDEEQALAAVDAAFEDACVGWPPERGRVKAWLKRLVRRRAWALRNAQLDRP